MSRARRQDRAVEVIAAFSRQGEDAGTGSGCAPIYAESDQAATVSSFLADQLRQLAGRDDFDDEPQRIARLIADLDGGEFAVGERATLQLAKLGRQAEKPLRKALENAPSIKARKRIEALLQQMSGPPAPERLQLDRALEALEWIGTEEARQALEKLSQQARHGLVKEVVTTSLRRLSR